MKTQNNLALKGTILLTLGIFFLMVNFDVFEFNFQTEFLRRNFWIFLVGGILLFKRKSMATGIAFLTIGTLFYLSSIGVIPHTSWRNIWPLFIIAAGFNILLARNRKACNSNSYNHQ